jgi:DNA-binding transcriptional MerR regulator
MIRPIDLAKRLNISTSSLRNYEAKGIIPAVERSKAGYRIYTKEHIAYFECTSSALKTLQKNQLDSALWIINKAQTANYEDKLQMEKAMSHLKKLTNEDNVNEQFMKIGDVSIEAGIPVTTLRSWEKEGYIQPIREEKNNYRLFDRFQVIKVFLMKMTKHAVYSQEVVQIKEAIKELDANHLYEAKKIIRAFQKHLHNRNRRQLHGLFHFYRLCRAIHII